MALAKGVLGEGIHNMIEVRMHSFNIFVHGPSIRGPTAAARTKVLQSTVIRRCGIGKICAGLLWEGTYSIKNEASLAGGIGSLKPGGGGGTYYKQVRQ